MNLNIEVIYHELKKEYTISATPSLGHTPLVSPMLYDGMTFQKNHVYIMENTDFAFLREQPADIALIITGSSLPQTDVCHCDILFIREKVPLYLIFNRIAEIFDRFNQWEQELHQYEGDYDNLRNMLTCSRHILGGTLTLVDNNFNLLAFTNDLLQRQNYYDSSTPNRTPQQLIEAALEDPEYRSSVSKRQVFLYPEYHCDGNALCCNLFRENEDVYFARLILMNDSNRYSGAQAYLLRFLSERIHRTLSRVSLISMVNSAYQNLGDLIRRTLKEPPSHISAVVPTLQGISWDIRDNYVVAVLSNPFERHTAIQDRSFCNQLEIILEETCAIIYENNIVLVSNISKNSTLQKESFDRQLTVFLRENLFKAGISNCIRDFSGLSTGYHEALAALELGNAKNPSLWCYHFNNYTIDYIIQSSTREIPFKDLVDERLLLLKEYDRKNSSQLFETLKTYIQYKYNVTRSSEALYIHRTTFLSRLDRIFRLTRLDLDDWDTRLLLMLSIRVLESD